MSILFNETSVATTPCQNDLADSEMMNEKGKVPGFDYSEVQEEHRDFLREKAAEVKRLPKTTVETQLTVGRILAEVKEAIKHGSYMKWCAAEFPEFESRTLRSWVKVYEVFSAAFKMEKFSNLDIYAVMANFATSATTLLVGAPQDVRDKAIGLASTGKYVSLKFSSELVEEYKKQQEASNLPFVPIKGSSREYASYIWRPFNSEGVLDMDGLDSLMKAKKPSAESNPASKNIIIEAELEHLDDGTKLGALKQLYACVVKHSAWNFLMSAGLSKASMNIECPDNLWMGVDVKIQAEVEKAELLLGEAKSKVKFVWCAPTERIDFTSFENVNVLILEPAEGKGNKINFGWVANLLMGAVEQNVTIHYSRGFLFGGGISPSDEAVDESELKSEDGVVEEQSQEKQAA